jgi:hypothetical protein
MAYLGMGLKAMLDLNKDAEVPHDLASKLIVLVGRESLVHDRRVNTITKRSALPKSNLSVRPSKVSPQLKFLAELDGISKHTPH